MTGFCPSAWEPCWQGCPPGVCRAHDVSRDGPDLAEFEEWRAAMEADLLRTLLLPLPPLPRRASTVTEGEGGTLPA
jgi:hypothetical protein